MDKTYTVGISTVLWKVFQPANALMDVMQGIDKLLVDENDVDYLTFQGLADLSKLAQEAVNRRNDEVEMLLRNELGNIEFEWPEDGQISSLKVIPPVEERTSLKSV